jgi:hypothetical protein
MDESSSYRRSFLPIRSQLRHGHFTTRRDGRLPRQRLSRLPADSGASRPGGYETWRARSSYLEVDASTQMIQVLDEMLKELTP